MRRCEFSTDNLGKGNVFGGSAGTAAAAAATAARDFGVVFVERASSKVRFDVSVACHDDRGAHSECSWGLYCEEIKPSVLHYMCFFNHGTHTINHCVSARPGIGVKGPTAV